MHAHWVDLPDGIVSCAVDLTVVHRPVGSDLYFWALQASFVDRGQDFGAGHLGLQHYPLHPGSSAANWGGYHRGAGGELSGSDSPLPSAPGNVNTRDFAWSEGRTYRLAIDRTERGWAGSVTDVASGTRTVIRELYAPSSHLGHIVMWSEIFAPCEGPRAVVRWSDPQVTLEDGTRIAIDRVSLNYQTHAAGGCSNTSTVAVSGGIEQRSATERAHPAGTVLELRRDS